MNNLNITFCDAPSTVVHPRPPFSFLEILRSRKKLQLIPENRGVEYIMTAFVPVFSSTTNVSSKQLSRLREK